MKPSRGALGDCHLQQLSSVHLCIGSSEILGLEAAGTISEVTWITLQA